MADALNVSPLDVLARTLARVAKVEQVNRLEIDLRKITDDQAAELAPLSRWAKAQLRHMPPGESTSACFDRVALVHLSDICGLAMGELIALLRGDH